MAKLATEVCFSLYAGSHVVYVYEQPLDSDYFCYLFF